MDSQPTKNRKPRKLRIAAGIAIAGILALLFRPEAGHNHVDMKTAHLCNAVRNDMVVSILQAGELRAKESRLILNEAYRDAKIVSIVEDGTSVTNGQLLVELESSQLMERYLDQQSDVAEAEASLKLAQENLEIAQLKSETDIASAKLKVELALLDLQKYEEVEYKQMVEKAESEIMLAEEELKKSRSELEGTQELFDKGYSNKNDLDSVRLSVQRKEVEVRNKTTDLKILQEYTHVKRQKELDNSVTNARGDLERLVKTNTANLESKKASIASKHTRLEIEKNQLATREIQFANTKVYADFEGQVFYPKQQRYGGQAKIEEGATVNFRQPLLSYPDLSAWNLKVGVPEAMIDKVELGQEAVASLEAVPGLILHGKVMKISAVPDSRDWYSSGVKTYTIIVDVTSDTAGQLKPGMSATVEIVTDRMNGALNVPMQSVVSINGTHYVYVVKNGRHEKREVEIGKFNSRDIEILDGLKEGEELLLYAEVEPETDAKMKKSPLVTEASQKEKADKE